MWGHRYGSKGAWWLLPEGEWRPFLSFNDQDRGNIVAESAMASLGAAIVYAEKHGTNVVFDPAACPIASLQTVIEGTDPPFHFTYPLGGWSHRYCPTREIALPCISHIYEERGVVPLPGRLKVEPQEVEETRNPSYWRSVASNTDSHIHEMVVFQKSDNGLHYERVGAAAPVAGMLGPDWAAGVVGVPFDEGFTDTKFDELTSEAYCRVLRTGKPELSRVSGPLSTDLGIIHQNYLRLIVPIQQQQQCVASLAVVEPDVGPPRAA